MIGTLLNTGAIVLGAGIGLATRLNLSPRAQQKIKVLLGVATAFFGLRLFWTGLASGTVRHFFLQLFLVLVAMVLGHLLGRLLQIQAIFNRLGKDAATRLEKAGSRGKKGGPDGFLAATTLFCAAPLGLVGAVEDGLAGNFAALAIKAVMDGLAALTFARMFGAPILLAALPVAAFLSGFTLMGERLAPWLAQQGLLDVVHASSGLIISYVAIIVFEVRRVEIANYLPALVVAPVLLKLTQLF